VSPAAETGSGMSVLVPDEMSGGVRRVTWEHPEAAHQIRVSVSGSPAKIAISCTCLGRANEPHEPLARGDCFPDGKDMAIWREHMNEVASEHTA
jgi:hypothetical protein